MKRTIILNITVEAEVDFSPYKAHRGAREGGLQLEPDEPAGADINAVVVHGVDIHDWEEVDGDEIVGKVLQKLNDEEYSEG